jgi:hypothetical protein
MDNTEVSNYITKKIEQCKKYDVSDFGLAGDMDFDFIMSLLNDQTNKCYVCKDNIPIMCNSKCGYRFSIARIDGTKPHDKNNIRITCSYCNNKGKINETPKVCPVNCHSA